MDKPTVGDLVIVHWRDSFQPQEQQVSKLEPDCTWFTIGFVVRKTEHFLYTAASVQESKLGNEEVDHHMAILWDQVLGWELIKP